MRPSTVSNTHKALAFVVTVALVVLSVVAILVTNPSVAL